MKFRTLAYITAMTLFAALVAPVWLTAQNQPEHHEPTHYSVVSLGVPLGGTTSGTAAINNLGWVAGASNLTGDATEHAELWVYGRGFGPRHPGRTQQRRALAGPERLGRGRGHLRYFAYRPFGRELELRSFPSRLT